MKRSLPTVLACVVLAFPAVAQAPGVKDLPFSIGYPKAETSTKLYDEMDYQRAVQAYIWAIPLVNSVAFKKGAG